MTWCCVLIYCLQRVSGGKWLLKSAAWDAEDDSDQYQCSMGSEAVHTVPTAGWAAVTAPVKHQGPGSSPRGKLPLPTVTATATPSCYVKQRRHHFGPLHHRGACSARCACLLHGATRMTTYVVVPLLGRGGFKRHSGYAE